MCTKSWSQAFCRPDAEEQSRMGTLLLGHINKIMLACLFTRSLETVDQLTTIRTYDQSVTRRFLTGFPAALHMVTGPRKGLCASKQRKIAKTSLLYRYLRLRPWMSAGSVKAHVARQMQRVKHANQRPQCVRKTARPRNSTTTLLQRRRQQQQRLHP